MTSFRPPTDRDASRRLVAEIIDSYAGTLERAYCYARFVIVHQRFLDELLQFMPREGEVLELGCGFGLFGLYFARSCPGLRLTGCDLAADRVAAANASAHRLGVPNARFVAGDATALSLSQRYAAIFMLDIVHHVPREAVRPLLRKLYDHLDDDGVLLIKDVDARPLAKMAFTWALDVAMTRELPHYWHSHALVAALRETGFQVFCHAMVDALPYPHRLYVCHKQALRSLRGA